LADYEKRGYLLENFRLFHLRTVHQGGIEPHYHEFCKLLFLLEGRGCYTVDGQRYLLQSGDTVLIGSRCVHRPELESGAPYERIILYISPEFLQQVSTEECNLRDIFSARQGHVLRLKQPQQKKLFSLVSALEASLHSQDYGSGILSYAALLQLLVALGQNLLQPDARHPEPLLPTSPRVRELTEYIHEHYAEDLDIDALAEQLYLSKFHMMRLFRQETGFTVYTYLTQRRLMAARQMIESGMRATEACYRCGFHSYSSFTRACNKYLGATPTGRLAPTEEQAE